ncbi:MULTISPECIES: hypothetical protein [unclassified Microbacterium]|nr:hypothetical protein [Microbacterium sp. Gd 4-13]
MSNDEDYGDLVGVRQRRVKVIAWVVIAALIITGGGATVFALLVQR